mgnify:CR=1 FL=1
MHLALLAFVTAFFITYFSVPALINLSLLKKLYDKPDHRKLHGRRITALGGIAIFGAFSFSFILFTSGLYYAQFNSILAGAFILFAVGVKDDLYPISPIKKMGAQLIAALIVVIQGNVRVESLYGLLGIHNLSYASSIIISVILFLFLINSFNFIDGINGLAGGVGVVVISTFCYFFYRMGEQLFVILCLAYIGALLAFLRYNFGKGRIFMGDSGSMVLGYVITVITLFFIQKSVTYEPNIFFAISSLVFAFPVLIIPIFDTLRVVLIRVFILKRSPFSADRNHIHHALLDIGLSQIQAASILLITNVLFVVLALMLHNRVNPKYQLIIFTLLATGLSQIPFIIKQKRKKTI